MSYEGRSQSDKRCTCDDWLHSLARLFGLCNILQDGVSEYMWHIPMDKKIKLDIIEIGGGGAGAIESLQRATLTRGIGYNIEQSLRQLLPGIAIEITERGIDGVLPGTELGPDTLV